MAAPARQYIVLSSKKVECAECANPHPILLATAARKGSLWVESGGVTFCSPAHYGRWLSRSNEESARYDEGTEPLVPRDRCSTGRWCECLSKGFRR